MPASRSFHDVLRDRYSVRSFRPDPVPDDLMHAVLEDARLTASNCNTQPWEIHIASGMTRDAISQAMLAEDDGGRSTPDFGFDLDDFNGIYRQRARDQGRSYHQAIGVAREAAEDRRVAARRNLEFFGAPHVALFFMPSVGDNVRVASDLGMFGQTFLLSLVAHGLGGVPQTMLGFHAGTLRGMLGIDPTMKMLFGVSFGYPDVTHAANAYRIGKASVTESVRFHR